MRYILYSFTLLIFSASFFSGCMQNETACAVPKDIDKVTFFDELKLTAEQVSKIEIGLDSCENMRNRISDSISNGADFAKSLI